MKEAFCSNCGYTNQYDPFEDVWVDEDDVIDTRTPRYITCQNCAQSVPVNE